MRRCAMGAKDMPITLPRIRNKALQGFTACGHVVGADTATIKAISRLGENPMVAEYSAGNTQLVLRAVGGVNGKPENHLHVDIIKKKYLPQYDSWKPNAALEDVLERLSGVPGREVELDLFAGFRAPLSQIPEEGLIGVTFLEAGVGELSIKLTAGEISISGHEFHTLRWALSRRNTQEIMVDIIGNFLFTFDENYLTTVWESVKAGYRQLILGGEDAS